MKRLIILLAFLLFSCAPSFAVPITHTSPSQRDARRTMRQALKAGDFYVETYVYVVPRTTAPKGLKTRKKVVYVPYTPSQAKIDSLIHANRLKMR